MCGIAGVLGTGADASAMISALTHRGPDGVRTETLANAQLAHARLSIIDLEGGWQPLHAAGATVIGNGEIYNYLELRERLAKLLGPIDRYVEIFDPYQNPASAATFVLSDDIADVTADLIHGLQHFRAGRAIEALWWWQFSYLSHWGTHAGAALRALQSVVAHARLDVNPE